jgi:hypothetical protein
MEAEISSAVRHGSESRPPKVRRGPDGRSFRIRSRSTNDPEYLPKQLNPRAQDRRRRDLVGALGGPEAVSPLVAMQVRRAAELVTAVEMARANMLNGVPTDMLALIRLEGVAARAVRALGLKPAPQKATPLGLRVARERWAAEEARKAKQAEAAREASATKDTEPPDGRAE